MFMEIADGKLDKLVLAYKKQKEAAPNLVET